MINLKKLVSRSLEIKQSDICAHIETVEADGKTTGIEKIFSDAFESQITDKEIKREIELGIIGSKTYYPDRKDGRLDCYIPSEEMAIEYKAVRLPRQHANSANGALYDIGQLGADYLRLNRAKKLGAGYIIAFVYGPLVSDARSSSRVYRAFHNQMFVDFSVADDHNQLKGDKRVAAFKELGWNAAWGETQPSNRATAIKVGSLGAICIDCRQE